MSETRDKRVMVRLTEMEFKKLKSMADRAGLQPSTYLRVILKRTKK